MQEAGNRKQEKKNTKTSEAGVLKLMVFLSCFMLLVSCFVSRLSWATQEEDPAKDQDPEVEITPSKGYGARKIFFFPLELPGYALKGVTLPLNLLGKLSERHHFAERIYDLLTDDTMTLFIYPNIDVGSGSGFGAGMALTHSNVFGRGYGMGVSFIIYTDLDHRASFSFSSPPKLYLFNRPVSFVFKSSWMRDSDSDFYQPGNNSPENSKAEFGTNDLSVGILAPLQATSTITISPHVFLLQASTRPASNAAKSVQNNFPASSIPGFGRKLTHLDFGFTIAHDTRDNPQITNRGGLRSFTFRRVQGIGNSGFDYNQYELDIRQFIPLWKPRYVLALRNAWVYQQETGSSLVPFYRLATLDVHSPLRGFDTGRFRDHGTILFNVEYRYPVWDYIDGTLFFDTGRVFDDFKDFALNDFKYSVGAGIEMVTRTNLLLRLQTAYGNDGMNFIFTASQSL